MNALFSIIFLCCCVILLIIAPESFLPTLLDGASKSASLCASLLCTYAVWLGLMRVWEDSGLSAKLCKTLRPVAKKLFLCEDERTLDSVCMNLSVNLLGISGAATPYGVRSAQLLCSAPQPDYALSMLLVINATSIQLIPTSVIGVRVALGSVSPADIVLPTLITTAFSTLLGIAVVRAVFLQKDRGRYALKRKSKGAGI